MVKPIARENSPAVPGHPATHRAPPPAGHHLKRGTWIVAVVLACLTYVVWLPALDNGLVNWDDDKNIIKNPYFRGLGAEQLRWMFTTFHMGPYQPLAWVTLGADYVLWGQDARGFHRTSVLFHAANAMLFYLMSLRLLLLGRQWHRGGSAPSFGVHAAAATAALVFALHPLRVESVAWVTERRDVVSGFFFLLTILAYLRAQTDAVARRRSWLALAVVAYVASLLGKGIAVGLPLVLLVLDWYPLRRLGGASGGWFTAAARRRYVEKIAFVVPALVAGVVATFGQIEFESVMPWSTYGLPPRIAQAFYSLTFYVGKTIVPLGLIPLYELQPPMRLLASRFVTPAVMVMIAVVAMFRWRQRWPAVPAAALCYLFLIAPVSGLAQTGGQIAADRYSYLACMSWALLVGGGFFLWWRWCAGRRSAAVGVAVLTVLLIATLSVLTRAQIRVWHDSESLWTHTLKYDPRCRSARINIAAVLTDRGEVEAGIAHLREALKNHPRDRKVQEHLAISLVLRGRYEEALEHYDVALELEPDRATVVAGRAMTLANLGRHREAYAAFQHALSIDPNDSMTHYNLGMLLLDMDRPNDALGRFSRAMGLGLVTPDAHCSLGVTLLRLGRAEEGVRALREALRLNPQHARARRHLQDTAGAESNPGDAESRD